MRQRRSGKYNAKRTEIDGIVFASMKEAKRYRELLLLVKAGEITHLVLQPRFHLFAAGPSNGGHIPTILVGAYVADFQYRDQSAPVPGITVVEDVKGMRTPLYKLKKKLAEACYGIQIREI